MYISCRFWSSFGHLMATLVTSLILSLKIHNWTSLNFSSIHPLPFILTNRSSSLYVNKHSKKPWYWTSPLDLNWKLILLCGFVSVNFEKYRLQYRFRCSSKCIYYAYVLLFYSYQLFMCEMVSNWCMHNKCMRLYRNLITRLQSNPDN